MRYQVATISLEPSQDKPGEVTYWLTWYGTHADQGGLSVRTGDLGSTSLERLLYLATQHLPKDKLLWLEEISRVEGK